MSKIAISIAAIAAALLSSAVVAKTECDDGLPHVVRMVQYKQAEETRPSPIRLYDASATKDEEHPIQMVEYLVDEINGDHWVRYDAGYSSFSQCFRAINLLINSEISNVVFAYKAGPQTEGNEQHMCDLKRFLHERVGRMNCAMR